MAQSKAATALNQEVEAQSVLIYDLKAHLAKLKGECEVYDAKNASLEKSIEQYTVSLDKLKGDHKKVVDELKAADEQAKAVRADAEQFAEAERQKIFAARKELEAERAAIAADRAKLGDEQHTVSQRNRKAELLEETLEKKQNNLNLIEQGLKSDRNLLHARKEEVIRSERAVGDRLLALESAEASFRKQQEILTTLEQKAQEANAAAGKARGEAEAERMKAEKAKDRIAKSAVAAKSAYELLKGVRNQLIALSPEDRKESVEKLLKDAFASLTIDLPAEVPPAQ